MQFTVYYGFFFPFIQNYQVTKLQKLRHIMKIWNLSALDYADSSTRNYHSVLHIYSFNSHTSHPHLSMDPKQGSNSSLNRLFKKRSVDVLIAFISSQFEKSTTMSLQYFQVCFLVNYLNFCLNFFFHSNLIDHLVQHIQ